MLSHSHSTLATAAQLDALPAPARCGPKHQPIPHGLLVQSMQAVVHAQGYAVTRSEFALGRHGRRLFGVMDLARPPAPAVGQELLADRGLSIGFRNSTDTTLAIHVVAGARVFVCDNLMLSGDLIALRRKNTTGLDLEEALEEGFGRFLIHASALDMQIEELRATRLTDAAAKVRLFDLFARRVLPMRLFAEVEQHYFQPTEDMPDCQPRTLWGLHNACTRAMKALPPARAFTTNVALGRSFGLKKPMH